MADTYVAQVSLTNESNGYSIWDSTEDLEDWLIKDDGTPDLGAIYRLMQQEYGRCQSSVYVGDGPTMRRCGWFFVSRQPYDDSRWRNGRQTDTYLRGAWVTIAKVVEEARPRLLERVAI